MEKEKIKKTKVKKIVNIILIIIGSISLGVGFIGIIVPILPTTPFLLLTLVCYARGSTKFENWFKSTKIYLKHLEPFLKTKAMTNANKVKILATVTILISLPIIFVNVLPMRILLIVIILLHYLFFIFKVKSVSKEELQDMLDKIKENERLEIQEDTKEEI